MQSRSKSPRPEGSPGLNWAERMARCQLEAVGLKFLAANHLEKTGELDLVMQDGSEVVFVEVRQRARAEFGSAAESIDPRKFRRLRATARLFLLRRFNTEEIACRFDAVLISGRPEAYSLRHLRGLL